MPPLDTDARPGRSAPPAPPRTTRAGPEPGEQARAAGCVKKAVAAARSVGSGARPIRPAQPTTRRMPAARAARTIRRTLRSPEMTTARERAEATQNDKGLTPELSRAEGVGLNDWLGADLFGALVSCPSRNPAHCQRVQGHQESIETTCRVGEEEEQST